MILDSLHQRPSLVPLLSPVPRGLSPASARQRGRLQPPHMALRLPSLSSAPTLPRALRRPPRRNLVARQRGRLQPPRMPIRLPWALAPTRPRVLARASPEPAQRPLHGHGKRPTQTGATTTMTERTPLTVTTARTTSRTPLTSVAARTSRQLPLPHLVTRRRVVPRQLAPAPARQRG